MSSIKVNSDPNEIAKVELFVEQICKDHKVGDDTFGNILISLTEAANNGIIHGNKSNKSKVVEISCAKDETTNRLVFMVKDEGKGFDYNALPDPTAPENLDRPCGRGVFLMMQLADLVIFSNNGATVELQFKV
jgi:serine/threonine-protein kinase RsbW